MDDFDGGFDSGFDGGYEDCFDPCNEEGGDRGAFERQEVFEDDCAERADLTGEECPECGEMLAPLAFCDVCSRAAGRFEEMAYGDD